MMLYILYVVYPGYGYSRACVLPRGNLHHLRDLVFARGEPVRRALQQGLDLLQTTDLRAFLPRLVVMPSLWLGGLGDRLIHPQAMQKAAVAARGDFRKVPHAGHAPFFSHTDVPGAILRPWLARCLARRVS